jgi:sporulation protein YlmC with PRC-barrel domain
MKKRVMMTAMFFTASLVTAAGVLAADESPGRDASKYGTSSSDMTRSGSMETGSTSAVSRERETSGQISATQEEKSKSIQAADDLKNFTVQDTRGEKIGKVSQVLVDLDSGRIGYAVVSSGGFLGMGGEKYIVPFNALKSGERRQTLTLDVQKDQLRQAPKGDMEQVMSRESGREIHQFYGVSPYWEENSSEPQAEKKRSPYDQPLDDDSRSEQKQEQEKGSSM